MPKYDDPELEKTYQGLMSGYKMQKRDQARTNMMHFAQFMRPDPNVPENARMSQCEATPLARLLCEVIERVDRGEEKRVCVSVGPQFGKSDRLSRDGPAWLSGRNPYRHLILGSYNDTFAQEFGGDVRELMQSERYHMVFPEHELRKGSEAKDYLVTTKGGKMAFVGVGGSGSGKPADVFFVDDPFKNDEDAQSATYREKVWKWFNSVTFARCHNDTSIIVVHCLTGDTRVLMADGTETLLRDIKVGDSVASYKDRKIVVSKVLNWKNQGADRVFTIRMKSGISIKANARHPFLVCENGEEIWRRTDLIKKGMCIRQVIAENGRALSAPLTIATGQSHAKDYALRTTTKRSGLVVTGHLRPRILALAAGRICATVTGLNSKITSAFFKSRTVFVRYVTSLQSRRAVKRLGMENSSSIIVTTPGKSGGSFATTATSPLGAVRLKPSCVQPLNMLNVGDGEVAEVVEGGVEDVFDIQVADTENFIANLLITHNTRWHEDDLIGRLCDPDHPERNKAYKGIAERWNYYNLPAIVEDPKLAASLGLTLEIPQDPFVRQQFGTKPMVSLWEGRKSMAFLAEAKMMDERVFGALYMGKPSPDTGTYFHAEDLVEYHSPLELPEYLNWYGASDHAVSEEQKADSSVLGCVGVDKNDDIWIPPDICWKKMETDEMVDEFIHQMKTHKPQWWVLESELISKSFGPFLKKRMHEEKVYITLIPKTPSKKKRVRARAIQGRIQMRKVHFPAFAPWWPEAKAQLLKFDYGTHDDFVDWISWIGLGLTSEYSAEEPTPKKVVKSGTLEWIKSAASAEERQKRIEKAVRGW